MLSPCETETGVVTFVELEPDGDLTIHLRADTDRLLAPANVYLDTQPSALCGPKGCLQIEIPCQGAITQRDALGTCAQFTGPVLTGEAIPRVGDHVKASAPFVEDSRHHNWHELHGAVLAIISRLPIPALDPSPPGS